MGWGGVGWVGVGCRGVPWGAAGCRGVPRGAVGWGAAKVESERLPYLYLPPLSPNPCSKVLRCFQFYCAASPTMGNGAFAIQLNQYMQMMKDMDMADGRYCKVEDLGTIFTQVNFETNKRSKQSDVNEDKALMRHELLECLVRIATKRYGHKIKDSSDCVTALLEHQVLPNLPPDAVDPDVFRRERLYSEGVDTVFRAHHDALQVVYEIYSNLHPVEGKPHLGIEEW